MFVRDAIGDVLTITQKHIDYRFSDFPDEPNTGFEAFLWDTFGNKYDDIIIPNFRNVHFIKNSYIVDYLNIGENIQQWIIKDALLRFVPPVDVLISDVPEYYRMIELVDDLSELFPNDQ